VANQSERLALQPLGQPGEGQRVAVVNAAVAAANIRRTQAGTDFYNGKLACFNAEEFPDVVKAEDRGLVALWLVREGEKRGVEWTPGDALKLVFG